MAAVEQEIMDARRAFPKAQELLFGPPDGELSWVGPCGWHDVSVNREAGAFAVVAFAGPLAESVGEVVRVSRGPRSVFVYIVASADIVQPISIARRAWWDIGGLVETSAQVVVESVS